MLFQTKKAYTTRIPVSCKYVMPFPLRIVAGVCGATLPFLWRKDTASQ